jgi:hypothetical protein
MKFAAGCPTCTSPVSLRIYAATSLTASNACHAELSNWLDERHFRSRSAVTVRANQRNLFLELVVGFRRLDLLIVESRHAQNLDTVADGLTFARYDPSTRAPLWCLHFWIYRLFLVAKVPADAKTLIAIARALRVKAIISSDAYKTLDTVTEHLPHVHRYFVQHGLFLDQQKSLVKREEVFPDHPSQVTLFATGDYDRVHYRRWGIRPQRVVPIGTLKNSVYLTTGAPIHTRGTSAFDLCIVEKGLKPNPDTDLGIRRRDSWEKILGALTLYCQKFEPRVVVAISHSSEPHEVLSWLKQHFPYEFSVTNHLDPFATYRAVDSSELTIGQASTVLCEALSRQRKCLSIDYADIEFWNLPGEGISRLVSPTDGELHDRINHLLGLDWDSYSRQLPPELRDLMISDPSAGISTINSTIRADLGL